MFLRVWNTALKAQQFTKIVRGTRSSLVIPKSNYASTAKVALTPNEVPAKDLNALIANLKLQIINNTELSIENLEAIAQQLDQESIDGKQALQILQFCRDATKQNQQEAVQLIWKKLKEKKFQWIPQHYAAIMQFYQNINDLNGLLKTYDEILEAKLKPPPVAYQIILHAYCRQGNIEKATDWLERMVNANMKLNENSFNRLAQCYVKGGEIEMANYALEQMKAENFITNYHTLIEFLNYYAKEGDLPNIKKTLDSFKENNIELRNRYVIDAIHGSVLNGHSKNVEELFTYLKSDDATLTFIQTTITRFVESGHAEFVPKLLPLFSKNSNDIIEFFVGEMKRLNTDSEQLNRVIDALNVIGIQVEVSNGSDELKETTDSITKRLSNPKATVVISYNSLDTDERRFFTFIREKNIAEVESLMEKESLIMNRSKSALIIELYTDVKNLDKALATLAQVRANRKTFRLDYIKVAKLVALMVEFKHDPDEIVDLISTNRQDKMRHRVFLYEETFRTLAAAGNDELLNKLYKSTIDYNHVEVTENSTKPLIEVHLNKGDFKRAVEVYQKIVEENNLLPMTLRLMAKLIEINEPDLLQQVYKIYETARGEHLAKYRLAFAYIRCGDAEKAKSILLSSTIPNLTTKITFECRALENLGKIDETKILLKATKGIRCDRHIIYRTLLELYIKNDRVDDAMELWTEHKNDKLTPNRGFVERFKRFMEKHNKSIIELKFKAETE